MASSRVSATKCQSFSLTIAVRSERTKPGIPHCSRRTCVSSSWSAETGTPSIELYEHMASTAPPRRNAASKTGRQSEKTSCLPMAVGAQFSPATGAPYPA